MRETCRLKGFFEPGVVGQVKILVSYAEANLTTPGPTQERGYKIPFFRLMSSIRGRS